MKRLIFLLVILSLIFTACDKTSKQSTVQTEDDYFIYNIDENISSFDVDENGILFYSTFTKTSDNPSYYIKTVNTSGELLNTYTLDNSPSLLAINNGNIYYSSESDEVNTLFKYSAETQTSVKIADLTDYAAINQIEAIDNKLYFIGINKKNTDKDYTLADMNDQFVYSGETLGCIDLNTGILTELAIDFPISFSKAPDGSLVIYAYDEKGGYYFVEYNTENGEFSDKTYHKIDLVNKFSVYNDKKDFVYQKTSNTFALTSASIDPAKGEIELVPDFKGGFQMLCQGGYTYCTNINSNKIKRIKNSSYIHDNDKITMISPEFYQYFLPFGCGYATEQKFLTDEEMALSLLSQDKSFDICFMNSKQTISENIRDKGSFYPLNDVDGVMEYLDACFPYIKDAATNSDGDIWMLPIAVDIPVLFYNEKVCSANGISLQDSMGLDDFFANISKLNQNGSLDKLYLYDRVSIINNFFYQYLRSNTNFSGDAFQKLAEHIKNEMKYSERRFVGNSSLSIDFSFNKNDNILLLYNDDYTYQYGASDRNNISACGLPYITDTKTNVATCYYFCVNPESKNLKETLQYISSYCEYLMSLKNIIIFKDRNIYPQGSLMDDLYNIYSNGDIQFTLPEELFMNDFTAYLKGEKELQDVITESNKRLDIYLNE